MEKVGQGNVFGNNLHRKQAFLDYKKSIFKWSQNYNLLKRLTHDLAHKLEVFLNYTFLGKIVQRNVFGIILCREEAIAS